MAFVNGNERNRIREKIAHPDLGDDHYGAWGILRKDQRLTILAMLETIEYLENLVDNMIAGTLGETEMREITKNYIDKNKTGGKNMDLETRLLFERAIGMLDALSLSAPKGIQEALAIATEMFDEALQKAPCVGIDEGK